MSDDEDDQNLTDRDHNEKADSNPPRHIPESSCHTGQGQYQREREYSQGITQRDVRPSSLQRRALLRNVRFNGEIGFLESMQQMLINANVLHFLDQLQQEKSGHVQW